VERDVEEHAAGGEAGGSNEAEAEFSASGRPRVGRDGRQGLGVGRPGADFHGRASGCAFGFGGFTSVWLAYPVGIAADPGGFDRPSSGCLAVSVDLRRSNDRLMSGGSRGRDREGRKFTLLPSSRWAERVIRLKLVGSQGRDREGRKFTLLPSSRWAERNIRGEFLEHERGDSASPVILCGVLCCVHSHIEDPGVELDLTQPRCLRTPPVLWESDDRRRQNTSAAERPTSGIERLLAPTAGSDLLPRRMSVFRVQRPNTRRKQRSEENIFFVVTQGRVESGHAVPARNFPAFRMAPFAQQRPSFIRNRFRCFLLCFCSGLSSLCSSDSFEKYTTLLLRCVSDSDISRCRLRPSQPNIISSGHLV
jgi:hypothetical protein